MTPTHGKVLRVAALLTAFCVAQVYVLAGPVAGAPAVFQPQTGGTLKTTDNRPVLVNGNSVKGGTTVLPNSSVETPAGVGATVQLGFAEVIISPGSELVLDFTPGKDVTVTLKRGCVVIKTQGDAQGTIVRPDGTTVATGEGRVANACDREGAVAPVATQGGAVGGAASGIGGISNAVFSVLIVSASVISIGTIALVTRGDNPSPSNP
jgi:hypothetical protein